ncbi:hypothetical protein NM208_g5086 [Fusarium decemcellulare]|uniref:Uncharacterized protein n=1 Tax=Fusarium decemcellulare TaxID=57161 RepID=A0ACC1SIC1_9HYPO|nr:hypothetical protein NM208_g5086 [Fusarium decemcellulare]
MACQNVGPTNPDIAGLGIVISFAFQAGLSIVLSIWSCFLQAPTTLGPLVQHILESSRSRPSSVLHEQQEPTMQPLSTSQSHERQERRMQSPPNSTRGPSSKLLAHGKLKIKAIDKVLVTISDAQTWNALGLLIAALVQCNSLSLYHLHIVYDTVSFTGSVTFIQDT